MSANELVTSCLFLILLISATADAVRCKCTKESETVTCTEGVCETENGSCLMLDHPTMGVHYTCHTRGLKDGSCHNRTSKSGVSVRICGCNGPDFCNFSMWPEKTHHHKHHHQHNKQHHHEMEQKTDETHVNSAPQKISVFVSMTISLLLTFF